MYEQILMAFSEEAKYKYECADALEFSKKISDKAVKLVITSPPYNIGIIWHFGHGLHCTKRFSGRYENILWFTKSNDYTFNIFRKKSPASISVR